MVKLKQVSYMLIIAGKTIAYSFHIFVKHYYRLQMLCVFDSGNAVLGEAFTHTPPHPQKTDKKSRQQTESSFTKCK